MGQSGSGPTGAYVIAYIAVAVYHLQHSRSPRCAVPWCRCGPTGPNEFTPSACSLQRRPSADTGAYCCHHITGQNGTPRRERPQNGRAATARAAIRRASAYGPAVGLQTLGSRGTRTRRSTRLRGSARRAPRRSPPSAARAHRAASRRIALERIVSRRARRRAAPRRAAPLRTAARRQRIRFGRQNGFDGPTLHDRIHPRCRRNLKEGSSGAAAVRVTSAFVFGRSGGNFRSCAYRSADANQSALSAL